MDMKTAIFTIVTVALTTAFLRFLPFLIFNGKKQTPKIIVYLGRVLPFSVMAMLVIYCFRTISFTTFPFGISELIASGLVVLLHAWKKNTLLSIGAGTAVYMILIQSVFV